MSASPNFMNGSGGTVVIIGKSDSGKTHLTRCLIRTFGRNFTSITIFTGTDFTTDWNELGIKPELVSVPRLERYVEVCADEVRITGKKGRHLLIVDDMMGCLKSTRGGVFSKLATSGRHYGITSIWLSQSFNFIDTRIRSNVNDWIFMSKQLPEYIKGIWGVSPMEKAPFLQMYNKLEKYDYVYINPGDSKVIFSHKLRNDGFKLTQVLSHRDRVVAQIEREAAMRAKEQKQCEVPELGVQRESPVQKALSSSSSSSREPTEETEETEDRGSDRRTRRSDTEVRTDRGTEESKSKDEQVDKGSSSGRNRFEDKFSRLRGFKVPEKLESKGTSGGGTGGRGDLPGVGIPGASSRIQSSIL